MMLAEPDRDMQIVVARRDARLRYLVVELVSAIHGGDTGLEPLVASTRAHTDTADADPGRDVAVLDRGLLPQFKSGGDAPRRLPAGDACIRVRAATAR